MNDVVATVRAEFERVKAFRYLVPRADAEIEKALDRVRASYEAHLRAVAPFARGPLPEARVERHDSVASVWLRIGMPVPASPRRVPVRAPGEPTAPVAPTGFGMPGPTIATTDAFRAWSAAYGKILDESATRLRASPEVPRRIAELGKAFGVKPTYDDPYHALQQVLAEAQRAVYWEHPAREASERVESMGAHPHQVAARALEEHVRWVVSHGDASGSPFAPVLDIWSVALWPVLAPDGVLLLLCPSPPLGRVVFDPGEPAAPWPKLGSRISGGNDAGGWQSFDDYAGAIGAMGLGPLPGSFEVMHAWGPSGGPR